MPSTFFGISIAHTALSAQRRAMDVVGYNIAHANDPTYKRQRMVAVEGMVLAQSQEASSLGVSAFGSGVASGEFQRIYDVLVENRMRNATQASANWEYKASMMSQLEAAIGEPSDTSLLRDLNNFWNAWQKVATQPESTAVRSGLLEDAAALSQRMQYVYRQMSDQIADLNTGAQNRVSRINMMTEEIARLNGEIGALESGQMSANDLLNRRDALVLELSKLVAVSQHGDDKASFVLSVGGTVLVQGVLVNKLTTETVNGMEVVRWADSGDDVAIQGGELRAIMDLRDSTIPNYLSQLNQIATSLVTNVNALHRTGMDMSGTAGGDFFLAGTTAANLCLDPAIVGHPELVAASATGAIGNIEIAQAISALKTERMPGGLTINEMYGALIGEIGATAAASNTQAEAHRLSLEQYTMQQQATSGVSLDEEMTNMIKFQQAYNAAARTLSVMDEMLGVLIERTGAVGR